MDQAAHQHPEHRPRAETKEAKAETKAANKTAIFTLVSISHAMNHVHSGVISVFYPIFREEFGIGYLGIGFLSTINQLVSSLLQAIFGFLARFVGRGVLLGLGNIVLSLGGVGLGFSGGYTHLVTWTSVRSVGASAQHPVGAATLVSHFPKNRARVLGFHQSAGNVGGWIAPLLASFLLLFFTWRHIFWLIAIPSLLMGIAYFAFRELVVPSKTTAEKGSKASRAWAGIKDYKMALSNRNIRFLTLAMMAGAAGRGTNVLSTYLTPYLVDTYNMSVARAGFFLSAMTFGGIVGPIVVGWLADRISRKLVAQLTLVFAALFNFSVIFYPTDSWLLMAHLTMAGVFMWARGPLIETLFTQSTDKATLDTLLSIYYTMAFVSGPIWTMVTGVVIDKFGITPAFVVMAASYILGMFFLAFVRFDETGKDST